jgi:hypothetical protein
MELNNYAHNAHLGEDGVSAVSRVNRYRIWRSHIYKWPEYISNRNKKHKHIDDWSQLIFNNLSGNTVTWNSGGMYFKDIDPNITVVEPETCPIAIPEIEYVTPENVHRMHNKFDNLIAINPQSLKFNHSIYDFLTRPAMTKPGWKPNLLAWLRKDAKIFLSFTDWYVYFDRLTTLPEEFVEQQIKELEQHGITCQYSQVNKSGSDVVNGNIYLVLVNK